MQKIVAILLLSIHSSLIADDGVLPNDVTWGIYCGECAENCSTIWKIEKSSLSIDESDRFFETDPFDYKFKGEVESKEKFEKFKWILNEVAPAALKKGQTIFGQPDAYDQCGYYLAYGIGNKQYKALIDPAEIPIELKETVNRLFK